MAPRMSAEEKKWRAQEDAHVLASANEIKNDPTRLKNAQTAANAMVEEQQKRTNALKSVAGRKTNAQKPAASKTPVRKPSTTRASGKKK